MSAFDRSTWLDCGDVHGASRRITAVVDLTPMLRHKLSDSDPGVSTGASEIKALIGCVMQRTL